MTKAKTKTYTHAQDFAWAWIYRAITLLSIPVFGFLLASIYGDIKEIPVLKVKIDGVVQSQTEQREDFRRFQKDQAQKFRDLQDELRKKADKK